MKIIVISEYLYDINYRNLENYKIHLIKTNIDKLNYDNIPSTLLFFYAKITNKCSYLILVDKLNHSLAYIIKFIWAYKQIINLNYIISRYLTKNIQIIQCYPMFCTLLFLIHWVGNHIT